MKRRILQLTAVFAACSLVAAGCAGGAFGQENSGDVAEAEVESTGDDQKESGTDDAAWEEAMHTPMGKYPETVVYTLGKISGANNSNLPVGDTYEDNAYTRYLREVLNIQNEDVFELEAGGS